MRTLLTLVVLASLAGCCSSNCNSGRCGSSCAAPGPTAGSYAQSATRQTGATSDTQRQTAVAASSPQGTSKVAGSSTATDSSKTARQAQYTDSNTSGTYLR